MSNYTTIKIPKDLAESIDRYIDSTEIGYRNRTEFVVEATRGKLISIQRYQVKKEATS